VKTGMHLYFANHPQCGVTVDQPTSQFHCCFNCLHV